MPSTPPRSTRSTRTSRPTRTRTATPSCERHWRPPPAGAGGTGGTVLLGVALLLLGGFIAGVQVQKAYGDSGDDTAGLPTGAEGLPGGGAFGGGLPGGQNGGADAAPTTGTVTLVDGDTVYVETADGDLLTIRTDDDTQVRVPGELSDLETGDEVAVEGEDDDAGTISATTITRSD